MNSYNDLCPKCLLNHYDILKQEQRPIQPVIRQIKLICILNYYATIKSHILKEYFKVLLKY